MSLPHPWHRRGARLLLLVLGAALFACATVTEIPIEWRDPGYEGGPLEDLLVIAVADSETSRRLFEDRLAAALSRGETRATHSYRQLPRTDRLGEEEIGALIDDRGYDGVVITRMLGVEREREYVPGHTDVVPRPYGGYYGYYRTVWAVVHQPGYYVTHEIVRLETKLYSMDSGELIWSGQSETFDPESARDVIDSVVEVLAEHLRAQDLVR